MYKEKTVPSRKLKDMEIKTGQWVREMWTTRKDNSRKLNPPILMGNEGLKNKRKLS